MKAFALRVLRFLTPGASARVSHPNLVALHELLTEQELWFITMEHINGTEFVDFVNATPRPAIPESVAGAETRAVTERLTRADVVASPRPLRPGH